MVERPIEGFFVESIEGLIFDVKGLVHPPDRVIAYIRYVPDPEGDRERRGSSIRYAKVYSLRDRELFLRTNFPEYLYFDKFLNRWFQAVPYSRLHKVYDPIAALNGLLKKRSKDRVEALACELASFLESLTGIGYECIGVSGSLLVGLHTDKSDIDLVVYGEKAGRALYRSLKTIMEGEEDALRRYTYRELLRLYELRVKDTFMPLNSFLLSERRKVLQGVFRGRDFYIRLIKEPEEYEERYGQCIYRLLGRVRIRAMVSNDRDSIFTPCRYLISQVRVLKGESPEPIREIISFRGRFCEQAFSGENILAEGSLELVESESDSYCRLVIGGHVGDFLCVL